MTGRSGTQVVQIEFAHDAAHPNGMRVAVRAMLSDPRDVSKVSAGPQSV
jgi:hypothetical protein